MLKRTWVVIAFSSAICCVAAVGLVRHTSVETKLRDHATRLPYIGDDVWTAWLSQTSVLYPIHDMARSAYTVLNVTTGARVRVAGLDSLRPDNPVVSPDGRRIAWARYDPYKDDSFIYTSDVTGEHQAHWQRRRGGDLCWSSDSNSVVELLCDDDSWTRTASITPFDGNGKHQSVTFPAVALWGIGPPVLADNGHLLGYTPPLNKNGHDEITLYDTDFGSEGRTSTYAPRLPDDASVYSVVFSPRGDRVLWVLRFDNDKGNSASRILRHLLPGLRGHERFTLSVWVSAPDGRHMCDLGVLARTNDDVYRTPPPVKWLPGGNSFVFSDSGERWIMHL